MHKHYLFAFSMSVIIYATAEQQKIVVRNPFSFASEKTEKQDNIEKPVDRVKEDPISQEAVVALMSTETQWQVKNVLPTSVIMQHKEDGQIREITLTGSHVSF